MKEKAPAFQFYPKDLLSDGIAMSFSWSLLGRYLKLLCFDWMDDGILDSDSAISRLAGLEDGADPEGPKEAIRLLRLKFIKHPTKQGFISNPRLQKERIKQANHREISSRGGKQSAKQRVTERATKDQPDAQVKPNTPSPSPSPKDLKPIKQKEETGCPNPLPKNKKELIFEDRWQSYAGEKDNKKTALGHWNAKIHTQKDVEDYDKAVLNYYAIVAYDKLNGFPERRLKGGKTWFNNFESYINQKPPGAKGVGGIAKEEQKTQTELEKKCFSQLAFVEEELAAGEVKEYQWFYMALDKRVMEYEQRFGSNPFEDDRLDSYNLIMTEMKAKEQA